MFDTDYGTIDIDNFEYFIETCRGGYCASAEFAGYELEGNVESTPADALRDVVNHVRVLLGLDWELDAPIPNNLDVFDI